MHIYMPLIILMKLTSSHSTPLTHLISLNSSHLCSYIYFFIFIYPSPICFFIKLLTCGVIRSYNVVLRKSTTNSAWVMQFLFPIPKRLKQSTCLVQDFRVQIANKNSSLPVSSYPYHCVAGDLGQGIELSNLRTSPATVLGDFPTTDCSWNLHFSSTQPINS